MNNDTNSNVTNSAGKTMIPRKLEEKEVHIKVIRADLNEVELALYTDRMTVENIMDETFGPMNWMSSHKTRTKGNGEEECYCAVSVWDERKQCWIMRDDVGDGETDKIQCTDAFKRACVNFGIARELYTLPEPLICSTSQNVNGKIHTKINISPQPDGTVICPDSFSLLQYCTNDAGRIDAICIKDNSTGEKVFLADYANRSKKAVTLPSNDISEHTESSESVNLNVFENMIPEMGKFHAKSIPLKALDGTQMYWVFNNTKNSDVKHACLELAYAKPEIKTVFISSGVNPEQLIKNYR